MMNRCLTYRLIIGLLLVLIGVLPAHCRTRQVVLLYDERTTLPGLAAIDASIARTLTSSSAEPIEVYRESMDLSRFGSDPVFASSARLPSQEICRQEDRCGRCRDESLVGLPTEPRERRLSGDSYRLLWNRQERTWRSCVAISRDGRTPQAGVCSNPGHRAQAPSSAQNESCLLQALRNSIVGSLSKPEKSCYSTKIASTLHT